MIQLPHYQDNSLVNLMSRLAQELGAENLGYAPYQHAALPTLANYRHIVLLIIDGLGSHFVDAQSSSFLQSHKRTELTSVFPTTTASAITTFMTGLAPQQHGLIGWYTYLKEVGAVTAVLPCQLRGSRERLTERGVDIASLYGHTPIFDGLDATSAVLAPEWIVDSPFNIVHSGRAQRHGYGDLTSMLSNLHQLLRQDEPRYIYAYWPDFDRLSHQFGNSSTQVRLHYQALDEALAQFLDSISGTDTLMLITADHGFIDTHQDRVVHLEEHPVLQDCLSLPLSGEPRVAYCFVHPNRVETFTNYVGEHFTDQMDLFESQELIARGAFGLGAVHPQLEQRAGDFTLIMKENYVIKDKLAGEQSFFQYGVHGGVSPQEMLVPLIVMESR